MGPVQPFSQTVLFYFKIYLKPKMSPFVLFVERQGFPHYIMNRSPSHTHTYTNTHNTAQTFKVLINSFFTKI